MELGKGTYSKIYKQDNVAVKVTPFEFATCPWIEVILLSRLTHEQAEGVVKMVGARTTPRGVELELELADTNLHSYVRGPDAGCLSPDHTREIVQGVIKGLSTLHSYHIVHADVSPANVLVWREPFQVKIADLGRSFYTKDGFGTGIGVYYNPLYRAPEMELNESEKLGSYLVPRNFEKADVWALGGLISFLWQNLSDTAEHVLGDEQSAEDKEFEVRCLNIDPEKRPCLVSHEREFPPEVIKKGPDFEKGLNLVSEWAWFRIRKYELGPLYERVCITMVAIMNNAKHSKIKLEKQILRGAFGMVSQYHGIFIEDDSNSEALSRFIEETTKTPRGGYSIDFSFESDCPREIFRTPFGKSFE